MHVFKNQWYENSVSVERGPLTYALKMDEERKTVKNDKDPIDYGNNYVEVRSSTPWNYGLLNVPDAKLEQAAKVIRQEKVSVYPWNLANAPPKSG